MPYLNNIRSPKNHPSIYRTQNVKKLLSLVLQHAISLNHHEIGKIILEKFGEGKNEICQDPYFDIYFQRYYSISRHLDRNRVGWVFSSFYLLAYKPSSFLIKISVGLDFWGKDDNFEWGYFEKFNGYFENLISKRRLFRKW